MRYQQFQDIISNTSQPVVLVEGTRALPADQEHRLAELTRMIAREHPSVVFRSGNASGSDAAFAQGVASVDPERLENILAYPGMRRRYVLAGSKTFALSDVTAAELQEIYRLSVQVSPKMARIIDRYMASGERNRLTVKALYLLRDTLKVAGAASLALAPATFGIFFVNPDKPLAGGTGHTIRVCQALQVPVVRQDVWDVWI